MGGRLAGGKIRLGHRVHMDLIGPLTVAGNGKKYILTVTDALIRYVFAEHKEARTVAEALMRNFMKFGIPSQIVSDQGREFMNSIIVDLCSIFKISRNLATACNPSSNGLIERANGKLMSILRPIAMENSSIWESTLPVAVFANNSAYHRASGDSQYFLLCHTDPRIPFDDIFKAIPPFYNMDNYKQQLNAVANKVFERVQSQFKLMSDKI